MLATRKLTLTSQAATTAGGQSAGSWVGSFNELLLFLDVTALTGTGPSLTVFVDVAPDGDEWNDGIGKWFQIASFAAQTAVTPSPASAASGNAAQVLSLGRVNSAFAFGGRLRIRWTLTGTTPSATFTVKAVGKGA